MQEDIKDKWVRDTAKLFYQIFSVDYEDEKFIKMILTGGGGNSTLCSTWTHLSDDFIKRRISKGAYEKLKKTLDDNERDMIKKENNVVIIPNKIFENHHGFFYNNAKGVNKRKKSGKYFHFDHNPSNKKVLDTLYSCGKDYKMIENIIQTIQTIDLITIEQDEIRTSEDRKAKPNKLSSKKRDELIKDEFYELIILH